MFFKKVAKHIRDYWVLHLMALPGVGQKTAGVVLMAAFGDPQIPVDTHVFRVSRRIGLAHIISKTGKISRQY